MKNCESMHVLKYGVTGGATHEAPHVHEFIEIVYVLSGSMTQVIDGQNYRCGRGDVLFMNYGCVHEFFSDSDYTYINVLFSPQVVGDRIVNPSNALSVLSLTAFNEMRSDASFGRMRFSGNERTEIEGLLFSMLREYEEGKSYWETVLGNYLNTFIIRLLRKSEMGMEDSELRDLWQKLSDHIDENFGSRLTLSDLAEKCFYNPSYFSRVFKEKFGMTFLEYLTKKRLKQAAQLLEATSLPVKEIYGRVGFTDGKSFYNAFSKYYSCTPSEYRKEAGKKTE